MEETWRWIIASETILAPHHVHTHSVQQPELLLDLQWKDPM